MAPLRAGHITRVEVLGGQYLYAINVFPAADSLFNLCPADVCQTTDGRALSRSACALDAPKTGLRVERADPPASIIEEVEQIARHVGLDVGGIEYLIDDRDGRHYFYDVNALSNFVADARRVIGFDPHERLVDYLLSRAAHSVSTGAATRSGATRGRRRGRRDCQSGGVGAAMSSGERPAMRYGYWMPVFGGWLRNVPDEQMETSWNYVKRLACRSEEIGYDLSLVAELFLNDIKGIDAPSLDAWSPAAALAAVTERLELMVAVRPTFHQPAILAKQAATSRASRRGGFPSTSYRAGGPTRRAATGCGSTNTMIDTRARTSG